MGPVEAGAVALAESSEWGKLWTLQGTGASGLQTVLWLKVIPRLKLMVEI